MRIFALLLGGWIGIAGATPVEVPAGVDHSAWDRLARKYVSERGWVDYAGWKQSPEDLAALREYLVGLNAPGPLATGADREATLINAYNALTVQWILDQFPVRSIKDTKAPWSARRHKVGGRLVSLDEIEHDTLRPVLGYRVHAVLVCAAKSCPPLRNAGYSPDKLGLQLDERMRVWLGREDLNHLTGPRLEVSKIFEWYGKDFAKADGGLPEVLRQYAPGKLPEKFSIGYRSYNWLLNGQ